MTAATDQTTDSQPIEIERFRSPVLAFEVSYDLSAVPHLSMA